MLPIAEYLFLSECMILYHKGAGNFRRSLNLGFLGVYVLDITIKNNFVILLTLV